LRYGGAPTHWLVSGTELDVLPEDANVAELRWALLPADINLDPYQLTWGGRLTIYDDYETAKSNGSHISIDRDIVPVAPQVDAQAVAEDEHAKYNAYMEAAEAARTRASLAEPETAEGAYTEAAEAVSTTARLAEPQEAERDGAQDAEEGVIVFGCGSTDDGGATTLSSSSISRGEAP
jgi:hypothetical protein